MFALSERPQRNPAQYVYVFCHCYVDVAAQPQLNLRLSDIVHVSLLFSAF